MQMRQRRALVAERGRIGRPALQRAVEPGQRVLVAAEPVQDRAGIVANLGAGGIETMGAFDVGQRLLERSRSWSASARICRVGAWFGCSSSDICR